MRTGLLNIILIVSFCSVVFVYYQKDKRQENYIDYYTKSMSGLKKIIPPNACLNYKGIHSDPVNQWETYLFPRYVLAPAVLGTVLPTDSTLVILRLDADTPGRFIDSNTRIIWEYKDTAYHYYFIKQ